MFDLVLWLFIGLLTSWILTIVRPSATPLLIIADYCVGMLGAILGGQLVRLNVGGDTPVLAVGCGAVMTLTLFRIFLAKISNNNNEQRS